MAYYDQSAINQGIIKEDEGIKHLNDVSKIVPYVYISSWRYSCDPKFLDAYGIKHILCIAEAKHYPKEIALYQSRGINYLELFLEDNHSGNMTQYYDQICQIITLARNSRQNILVHCVSGQSRSPAAVLCCLLRIAYSGAHKPLGNVTEKILDAMKLQRPCIDILPTFLDQVKAEETRLRGSMPAVAAIKPTVFGAPSGQPQK